MSFWPLAKTLTELLLSGPPRVPLVELGAGDGSFARRLEELGLSPLLLDRNWHTLLEARALSPSSVAIGGEFESLPFRDESLGTLVCSNVLRHCRGNWERLSAEFQRVMSREAVLIVLEDDADDRGDAARNYRDALRLLAAADPSRGPAMAEAEVDRMCVPRFGAALLAGVCQNESKVGDNHAPLRWLASRDLSADGRRALRELSDRVDRQGMSYGRYLYRAFRRSPSCAA